MTQSGSTAAKPTVLIVDDDGVNRTLLAELLHEECRVVLAKDGSSAIGRAQAEAEIDLILLDISMPDMDGYEVLKRLRWIPATKRTPVIFISAAIEAESEERGLQLGAVDYVHKPIRPVIVRARVRNHLELVTHRKELERLADRDGLTGIANRRRFDEAYDLAWRRASRIGQPLNIAMIDVDHFKRYNDLYGHVAGDEALREIAQVIDRYATGTWDIAARYGGEEFVLLLSGEVAFGAILSRLHGDVASLRLTFDHSGGDDVLLATVSCGGVTAITRTIASPSALLREADALLYQAKREGRNRVLVRGDTAAVDAGSAV
ncbi:diguanylate cyclase [Skermania piniformis]|uniref:Diguanylate cyclase n=1 Tax=Skermania pinensis TaxID=39122 RepID=A0ABX8SAB9_9ACTN|nr:diguanylate cyclase [Skermania piniformis]QXQ14411.1 diguanylate cyclase [Skermania piniformis]